MSTPQNSGAAQRLTCRQTLSRIRADRARLVSVLALGTGGRKPAAFWNASAFCVLLYRISNHFFLAGHTFLSRIFWQLNLLLTGACIEGPAEIGEGFVVLNPPGICVAGKAGRNLTMMPCSGLGSELSRWDEIGAGPGLPVLGDDVVLEPHSAVLGPVQIGSRVRIAAGLVVTQAVPEDTIIEGPAPRFLPRRDLS